MYIDDDDDDDDGLVPHFCTNQWQPDTSFRNLLDYIQTVYSLYERYSTTSG